MKLKEIIALSVVGLLSSSCFACQCHIPTNICWNRLAVQGAISTGGNLSIGLVDYTEKTEIGVTISGSVNNARRETRTVTPVIFGGLRNNIWNNTYFAYGLNVVGTFGREHGQRIQSDYQGGPYISLEQMLTCHLMLSGWILPYQYGYVKTGGSSTTTNSFFNSGGIGLNYLF